MTSPAYLLAGIPLRHEIPPLTLWCECGVGFEHPTRAGVERLHAEHQAEMRNPDDHQAVPF